MRIYKYVGKNLNGKTIKGDIEANNLYEVIKFIREKGYYLISFKKEDRKKKQYFGKRKISHVTISTFCNQFKITLQAGLTILESLHILSLQCSSKILKENLQFIDQEIRKGESLYLSLLRSPFSFPIFLCNMVRIGEESGKLENVLEELSNHYYKEHRLRKKIISAMFYPIIVLIMTFILVIVILITVIPSITSVLISLDAELPLTTKIIMNCSYFLKNNFTLVTFFSMLISVVIILISSFSKKYFVRKGIFLKIPLIGIVYRNILEMQLTRALMILLGSGINIVRSLEILVETMDNTFLRSKLKQVVDEVQKGHSLSEAMLDTKFFSVFTLSFTRVGEETGNLEIMLKKSTMILEENVESDLSKLIELIQPAMLLFTAGIVGSIIASVILPIFNIANSI